MDAALRALNLGGPSELAIDGGNVDHLDSAGAWLILRTRQLLEAKGIRITAVLLPENYRALYQRLESEALAPTADHPRRQTFADFLARIGRGTMHVLRQTYDLIGFLGRVTVETWEAVLAPHHELPLPAFVHLA